MRKGLTVSLSIAMCFVLIGVLIFKIPVKTGTAFKENPEVVFKSQGKIVTAEKNEEKIPFEIKGVNMGSGYPGTASKYGSIKSSVYRKWFEEIAQMNANTIYVNSMQSPEFYTEFKRYNKKHDKKLYLVQTIPIPDTLIYSDKNIMSQESIKEIMKATENTIDALHGDKIILDSESKSLYCYWADISEYVIAYKLGSSWDKVFVEYNNKVNSKMSLYKGKYFSCTENASSFESFLAMWADFASVHEKDTYNEQHIIAFGNTAETDPFINDIKLSDTELEPVIDIEHIVPEKENPNGQMVSYNVFPYYPLFLQIGQYTKNIDEKGQRNSYRNYLTVLNEHHTCPVVISGFGVPSSRSTTHYDYLRNFSHGGLNEKEQANAYAVLYDDIKKSGCAGASTTAWQDEWNRTTWNEKGLASLRGKNFWCNMQSSELFGIVAFEPENEKYNVYPDEDFSEWKKRDVVFKNSNLTLSMKSDFKYLHIMVEGLDKKSANSINIALDISPDYGKNKIGDVKLSRKADFVIQLSNDGKSALYVDKSYDILAYSIINLFENRSIGGLVELRERYKNAHVPLKTDSSFNIVSRSDENTFSILSTQDEINNVGVLKKGNGNPKSLQYDSNADYYICGNRAHIRIPWQLLNFYDPHKCEIIDSMEENDYILKGKKISKIYVGAYYDGDCSECKLSGYKLKKFKYSKFHERKKTAYYELQKAFGGA